MPSSELSLSLIGYSGKNEQTYKAFSAVRVNFDTGMLGYGINEKKGYTLLYPNSRYLLPNVGRHFMKVNEGFDGTLCPFYWTLKNR
jgi:hypothetical protein